jgi:cobalt-zinc-cadmium efflux system protein
MGHDHHRETRHLGARLATSMVINAIIMVAQLVGGVLAGSLALISDALHNLSDVAALGVSYAAVRVGRRPADERYTFAFQRAEVLAALANAAALIAVAAFIAVEAVGRVMSPRPVEGGLVMAFAAFGMVANAAAAFLLRGRYNDLNLRSAVLHLVSDSVASFGVLLAGLVIRLWSFYLIDPLVSLALAAWMIKESWGLVRSTTHVLMQGVPEAIELRMVEQAIVSVAGVVAVHDLRVWALSSRSIVMSAHIVADRSDVASTTRVAADVKHLLRERFGVDHATLEIECPEGGCASTGGVS